MYYEAAAVDGAGRWRQFRRITMPLLIADHLLQPGAADHPRVPGVHPGVRRLAAGRGGPSDSTLFYTLYLYQQGFGNFDMGYASAMAWVLLVIIAVFTAINFVRLEVLGLLR